VDAADYVLWRKTPGSFGGTPAGFNAWRANFGATGGSGASLGSSAAVPEPGTCLLLLFAAMGILADQRRAIRTAR